MADDATKWHWSEGMKYALEGIKTLFILNGAAAISILTFIGNTKQHSLSLVGAMVCFALGAATGVPSMAIAYLSQLHYGNATQVGPAHADYAGLWTKATKFHNAGYFVVGFGILTFLAGVGFAAYGLCHVDAAPSAHRIER